MDQGLQERCLIKTVTFSHIHQLEITSGEARVAGGMSGKDCHIQSHPSTGVHIRLSKGCRWYVGKRLSLLVTSINWRLSEMEQELRAACGVCVTGKNSIHKIETV